MGRIPLLLTRGCMIAAVIMLVQVVLAPSDPIQTPYLSALSDLAPGEAMAAPRCKRTQCDNGVCIPGIAQECKHTSTGCRTILCNQ